MPHLEGFWDPENWSDERWEVYLSRRRGWWNQLQNRVSQAYHRFLGAMGFELEWRAREVGQWPSKTGSYDPCEDHYHYLMGAKEYHAAFQLKAAAQRRRSEFLA